MLDRLAVHLTKLSVGWYVDPSMVDHLCSLSRLTSLSLDGMNQLTRKRDLPARLSLLTALQDLRIVAATDERNLGMPSELAALSGLTSLVLHNVRPCAGLLDGALPRLARLDLWQVLAQAHTRMLALTKRGDPAPAPGPRPPPPTPKRPSPNVLICTFLHHNSREWV